MRLRDRAVALAFVVLSGGCYHFSFEQQPPSAPSQAAPAPKVNDEVTFHERAATYVNGFVGTGRMDAYRYCAHPIRTELRVTAIDVVLGFFTLLIYTPHTLYVTCHRNEVLPGAPSE
jgi:hypothetical protein